MALLAAALLSVAMTITGAAPGDRVGTAVASAGDVNGDGKADVLIGEQHAGKHNGGAAYVVFGGRGNVNLRHLGTRGFRITGARREAHTGNAVAAAGDVNGDGRPDLIFGLSFVKRAWVVYGSASPHSGFTLRGSDARFGAAVDGAFGLHARDRGAAYVITRTRRVRLPGTIGARSGWSVAGADHGVLVGSPYALGKRGIVTLFERGT